MEQRVIVQRHMFKEAVLRKNLAIFAKNEP
jgi:hypothetical protein